LAPVCSNCNGTDFVWSNELKTGMTGGGTLSLRARGEIPLGTRICRTCGHADLFLRDISILHQQHNWRPGEFIPIIAKPAAKPAAPAHHSGHHETAAAPPAQEAAPPAPPPPPSYTPPPPAPAPRPDPPVPMAPPPPPLEPPIPELEATPAVEEPAAPTAESTEGSASNRPKTTKRRAAKPKTPA
jgi:hypothetical protein